MKALLTLDIKDDETAEKKSQLQELVTALEASTPEAVTEAFIPYFRISKTFDEKIKVRYRLMHHAHQSLIGWFLPPALTDVFPLEAPPAKLWLPP